MQVMRLFLAIELDQALRRQLAEWQKALLPSDPRQRLSLTRVENLHITVKFLGEVVDDRVTEICTALEEPARMHPFEANLKGVACFPPRGPVRIVAADVEAPTEMTELHHRIEEALVPLGFPREGRAYHPHITLARARMGLPGGYRKDLASRLLSGSGASLNVSGLTLMSSDLTKNGPVYTPAKRFI